MGFKALDDKVGIEERKSAGALAKQYFTLAEHYASGLSGRACLIVVYGLPGVGKSSVSRELSKHCGLVHLRTDVLRKEMSGVSLDEHTHPGFCRGIYTREMSSQVYLQLLNEAEILLGNGTGCVLDGSFQKKRWRDEARQLAKRLKMPSHLVYCTCAEEIVRERLARRGKDPSDANEEVYLGMKERFDPPEPDSVVIDTSTGVTKSIDRLISELTCSE